MLLYAGWLTLVALAELAAGQLIQTKQGIVQGQTMPVITDADQETLVTSFWGIPYAAPPIGDLRFEPPQPAEDWDGIFVADTLPHMCMQNPVGLLYMTHPFWTDYDEDCLTLNIFKSDNDFGPLKPVMVWFYGGGYTGGGSIQYPGHFMATRDVIVVTVNYRIGVFGFANTPGGTIKGNMGMLDQVLSLEWVRDNIAAFHGDPNNVLIFGQSAGASSVALHNISPRSQGLFHKVVMESGTESNVWSLNYPDQQPELYIWQVAQNAGCGNDEDDEVLMVECLRGLSQRELRMADSIVCHEGYFCQGFAPVVDGPGGFIPDNPLALREQLGNKSVPIIGGHCKDDGSLYTIYFIPEADQGGFTREEFQYYLRTRLVDIFRGSMTDDQYEAAYNGVEWKYTPWPYIDDEEANRQAFNKLLTEAAFGYSWDRNAKMNSEYEENTYTYIQTYMSLNSTSFVPQWMGAPHNAELAYVWAYSYLLINDLVRADTRITYDLIGWVVEDMPYSDFVQTLWTNFAKYNNPTPTPIRSPYNDTTITWPKFSWNDGLKTLELDGTIIVQEDYRQPEYYFFTYYGSKIIGKPIKKDTWRDKAKQKGYRLRSHDFQRHITKMVERAITTRYPGQYEEKLAALKKEHNLE